MKAWLLSGIILAVLLILLFVSSVARRNGSAAGSTSPISSNEPLHKISVTLADITNGAVRFFDDRTGKARLGYATNGSNQIVIFSGPKGTAPLGEPILPVTQDVVARYIQKLQRDAEEEKHALQTKIEEQNRRDRREEADRVKREMEEKEIARSNEIVRAKAEALAYHDRYITDAVRYSIGILIVDESEKENMPLSYSVAHTLGKTGDKITVSIFKPAFVRDGLFDEAFAGQSDKLNRLALTNAARSIVFGRQSVQYSTNSQLELITASMKLEMSAVSAETLQSFYATTIEANGAGLSPSEARVMAEERILSQLTNGVLSDIEKTAPTGLK